MASRRTGLRVGAGNKKGKLPVGKTCLFQFLNPIEDHNGLRGTVAASANRPIANGGEAESTWAPDPPPRGLILMDV